MARGAAERAQEPLQVGVGEFKAHCLRLIEEVRRTRRPLVVTKRGQPVARLIPYAEDVPQLYGALRGMMTIAGDIVGPMGEEWDADR